MSSNMAAAPPVPTAVTRLTQLGVIMVTGPAAREYLQGQVTADLARLNIDHIQLACCNSAQGRVQAVFWMLERSDGIALLLPASIVESTVARLRKYVLRAKVKIEPATHLQVGYAARAALVTDLAAELAEKGTGLFPHGSADNSVRRATREIGLSPFLHREVGGISYFNMPGQADMTLLGAFDASANVEHEHAWKLAQARAGLPQVYPETHEAFVAQMLNIDLLGGINFEKGCYTGQEIIARAHFRGTVKRRMFLFRLDGAPPAPGTRILAGEQHAGDVVDAVATNGGCELLAVISLAQLKNELRPEGQSATLTRLELPYRVVEE
jgi:tRNA-modifying protein YgfZ